MAVYKRTYRGYEGVLTSAWSRFLIITKYAWRGVFGARFLTSFLVACCFFPLGCAGFIYLANNLSFLSRFNVDASKWVEINGRFFLTFLTVQSSFAYILTAWIGPGLVAPDLSNNGLPLYFCRPLSRTEYVLGKFSVLFLLLSALTWIPGLLLFGIQASLAGWEWLSKNWWIASSIFLGSVLWVSILSLIALAMSAWVKWRIAASALILGVFWLGAGLGAAVNSVLHIHAGTLIDAASLIGIVWSDLFGVTRSSGISIEEAWFALLGFCVICVTLLNRKIRAFEVIR